MLWLSLLEKSLERTAHEPLSGGPVVFTAWLQDACATALAAPGWQLPPSYSASAAFKRAVCEAGARPCNAFVRSIRYARKQGGDRRTVEQQSDDARSSGLQPVDLVCSEAGP